MKVLIASTVSEGCETRKKAWKRLKKIVANPVTATDTTYSYIFYHTFLWCCLLRKAQSKKKKDCIHYRLNNDRWLSLYNIRRISWEKSHHVTGQQCKFSHCWQQECLLLAQQASSGSHNFSTMKMPKHASTSCVVHFITIDLFPYLALSKLRPLHHTKVCLADQKDESNYITLTTDAGGKYIGHIFLLIIFKWYKTGTFKNLMKENKVFSFNL